MKELHGLFFVFNACFPSWYFANRFVSLTISLYAQVHFEWISTNKCSLTLISVGSFVHLQRGHVSKWYIAFICPIIPHFSFILSQNYLKWKMTHLSTSKKQFLVFQKGIKSGWHNLKVLPRSYSTIPKLLVVESWNSGFRFLFDNFLS